MLYTEQISSQKTTYRCFGLLPVLMLFVCSKWWCHRELLAEIMAKTLIQDQSNFFSGTNIQNSYLYWIQVQQSLFTYGSHILLEK